MKTPYKTHWLVIKAIFRYLKGTKKCGLLYSRTIKDTTGPWKITMYIDSDYITDVDTRRSRTGFIIYLNRNIIAFNSTLHKGEDMVKK